MVFEKPKRPEQQTPAVRRPNPNPPRINNGGGGNNNRGNNNSGGNNFGNQPPTPSPWLDENCEPNPDTSASFVEYLRWMRPSDSEYKDVTKLQVLQMAEEKANYSQRLQQLTKRTELIAGKNNTFLVKSSWRIRIGGHRGPESILLPAFDALGMPFIPSSTLRGVARTQAILEIIVQEGISWKEAEKKVAADFGSLEAKNKSEQAGKVTFLDAYPLPNEPGLLAMDMANNIWKWKENSLEYDPNPNPFLCLKEATFLIGLRLTSGCKDTQVLDKVKQWLITGLQSGIGSQVNTGYGELIRPGKITRNEFFRIEFTLEGQLIHGRQKLKQVSHPYQKDKDGRFRIDRQGKLKTDTFAEAEVRSIAFKSMLRYWFRTFALGVLETKATQEWEGKLFGAINPNRHRGWVKFAIQSGRVICKEPLSNNNGRREDCGEQQGILTLSYSPQASKSQQQDIQQLFKNLTWLMFDLGGIGQGARRPCYSRQNRPFAPWWRGSTLIPESDDKFWHLPETVKEFQLLFQKRLQNFYAALAKLTQINVKHNSLKTLGVVNSGQWKEAIDSNCKIVVCAGAEDFGKPYALALLHHDDLKVKSINRDGQEQLNYDGNLCGQVVREVKPSPVWISDLGDYQVVTVFASNCDPRMKYLKELKSRTTPTKFAQIFPI